MSDAGITLPKVGSGEQLRPNRSMELKITEGDDPEEFKEKVLGTTKLQEENKENATPRKPELLRMQSQIALPIGKKE